MGKPLRECVIFPLMRPVEGIEEEKKDKEKNKKYKD